MAKKYNKLGIRRDNNFSDLSNTKVALNNLLGKLVSGTNVTFISEDLDAIRGISFLGLTNGEYRRLVRSKIRTTGSTGSLVDFLPRVTYQNRFDNLRVFAGEPRLFGGNGLTARYYNETEVYPNTVGIFSGAPFKVDNFWENGRFSFLSKVALEGTTVNGGIEWEGYFIPPESRKYTFTVNSSSYYTFDFQTEGYTSGIGTYTEISRIGIASTVPGSGLAGSNVISIAASDTKYVSIGQSVSAVGIETGTVVSDYSRSGIVYLSPPTGISTAVYSNFSGNVTFSYDIESGNGSYITYQTYPLSAFERYRIRFRYYIPQGVDASGVNKYFYVNIDPFIDYFRYNYLYATDYDFSDGVKGNINRFIENSINLGGGTVGSLTDSNNYVRVITSKRVDIKYQPKTTVSSIVGAATSGTTTINTKSLSIDNTTGIEVGNYVFGPGIPNDTKVDAISINSYVVLDKNATQTTSSDYRFIDHRGYVGFGTGGSSAGTFTLTGGNTTNLKTGMIVIGAGISAYTKIESITSSSQFTISPSQTIGAGTTVYFYQSKGLINNGLNAFCGSDVSSCLTVTSLTNSGSTVIPVSSVPSSVGGWSVQGLYFADGTVITGSTSSSISISKATILNIPSGATITIADPAQGDKQLCCPPTDTSPPFNATLTGLETTPDAKSLRIENGNLVFNSLRASIGIGSVTTTTTTATSNMRLSIQTPLTNVSRVGTAQTSIFKILCSSQ